MKDSMNVLCIIIYYRPCIPSSSNPVSVSFLRLHRNVLTSPAYLGGDGGAPVQAAFFMALWTVKGTCDSRWNLRHDAVNAVASNIESVMAALD